MILVTGATGHFGTAAINFLLEKGISNIAALARNEEKAAPLKAKGVEVRIGNYDDYNSLVSAFKGVEKLLFVSGSEVEKRKKQHENVVKAAKEAAVKHIVYTSFERKNESETSPIWTIAEGHLHTEKLIKESGMTYTFMRNTLYAEFLPVFLGDHVLETGVFLPAGDGKVPFATRIEMAEAAAAILSGHGHEGKEYVIGNTVNYAFQEVADLISEVTGKQVGYTSPSPETYSEVLINGGVPKEAVPSIVGWPLAIQQGEFEIAKSDLHTLLGRQPTDLKTVVEDIYGR